MGTTIQEQTRQCLTNISAILEAAGSSMDNIVSATIVLADENDFAGMNEECQIAGAHTRAQDFHRRDRRVLSRYSSQ